MVRLLLWVAAALFLIWVILALVGTIFHGLIHLLWIGILVALAIWAWHYLSSGRRSHTV